MSYRVVLIPTSATYTSTNVMVISTAEMDLMKPGVVRTNWHFYYTAQYLDRILFYILTAFRLNDLHAECRGSPSAQINSIHACILLAMYFTSCSHVVYH